MDFTNSKTKKLIQSNYYYGKFLNYVKKSENPFIPYPHFETSIKIKSGASGGPVLYENKVIGVNCRGWDFGENINDDDNLSSIIPITTILNLNLKLLQLPKNSWEHKQLKENQLKNTLSVKDLISAGHIAYN